MIEVNDNRAEMTIEVDYFQSREEVMGDIARTGFWPTTYVSQASPELPLHYHDYDIIGYVISGATYLLDVDQNRIDIKAGTRLTIPRGTWHAEGAGNEQVTYIVTVNEPIPLLQALAMKEPKGPVPELT